MCDDFVWESWIELEQVWESWCFIKVGTKCVVKLIVQFSILRACNMQCLFSYWITMNSIYVFKYHYFFYKIGLSNLWDRFVQRNLLIINKKNFFFKNVVF